MEPQEVEVYVMISGNYCAFHEISINVVYDITNDIETNDFLDKTKEGFEKWNFKLSGGHSDVQKFNAIKIGDKYYVEL